MTISLFEERVEHILCILEMAKLKDKYSISKNSIRWLKDAKIKLDNLIERIEKND